MHQQVGRRYELHPNNAWNKENGRGQKGGASKANPHEEVKLIREATAKMFATWFYSNDHQPKAFAEYRNMLLRAIRPSYNPQHYVATAPGVSSRPTRLLYNSSTELLCPNARGHSQTMDHKWKQLASSKSSQYRSTPKRTSTSHNHVKTTQTAAATSCSAP